MCLTATHFSCRNKFYIYSFKAPVDEQRLLTFFSKIDPAELKEHLHAFEQISLGSASAGPIGKLDMASRFRWLTATRSTIVQASKVHPGLCTDPGATLVRLHAQLVL